MKCVIGGCEGLSVSEAILQCNYIAITDCINDL